MNENHLWERTEEEVGLKEAKPVYCPICTARALVEGTPMTKVPQMRMRRSRIHQVADVRVAAKKKGEEVRPYAFDLAFKCPECDYYCIFGVPADIDYAQEIIKIRGGRPEFVLPEEEWLGEAVVATRLSRWGYW